MLPFLCSHTVVFRNLRLNYLSCSSCLMSKRWFPILPAIKLCPAWLKFWCIVFSALNWNWIEILWWQIATELKWFWDTELNLNKGNCPSNQNWTCIVPFVKINNTVLKNDISILKQIEKFLKLRWNFVQSVLKLLFETIFCMIGLIMQEPRGPLQLRNL